MRWGSTTANAGGSFPACTPDSTHQGHDGLISLVTWREEVEEELYGHLRKIIKLARTGLASSRSPIAMMRLSHVGTLVR